MKRIVSLLLVLVMIFGVMPMASADTATPVPLTVTVNGSVVTSQAFSFTVTTPSGYSFKTDNGNVVDFEATWPGATVSVVNATTLTVSYAEAGDNAEEDVEFAVSARLTAATGDVDGAGSVTFDVVRPTPITVDLTASASSTTINTNVTLTPTMSNGSSVAGASYEVKKNGAVVTEGFTITDNVFKATAPGTYTITVTVGEATDSVTVIVASGTYTASAAAMKVYPGQTDVPVSTVVVKNNGETMSTGYTVAWTSGVTDVGKLSPISASAVLNGKVTITATGEEIPVTCSVTVAKVKLSCETVSAVAGTTAYLTITDDRSTFTKTPAVTHVLPTGLTATDGGASVYSTGTGLTSYSISGAADGNANAVEGVTVYVSFYKDNQSVEVTMVDGYNSFAFDNGSAIKETSNLAAKLMGTSYKNSLPSQKLQFFTTSNAYGKITLPSAAEVALGSNMVSYTDLGKTKFTMLDQSLGYFNVSYTWYDMSDPKIIYGKGVMTINFGEAAPAITYKTTNSKAVTFDEKDFYKYWDDCDMTGYPEYVVFEEQPYYGYLYETAAKKTLAAYNDRFYYAATASQLDLDAVTYDPIDVKASYTDEIYFTMYGDESDEVVSGTVVIKVGEDMNFTDVKASDYFYDAVQWAVDNGITSGTSATTFSPNATCTRAQVVTFLYRAAGEPVVYGSLPFTDVKYTDYYYDAVLWAYKNDITTGLNATTFGPNSTVTRGQVVTFLHRALGEPYGSSYNPFTDVKSSDYYADAVLWAYKNDVTTGLTATSFGPASGCTRGQIVTFLYRAYEG